MATTMTHQVKKLNKWQVTCLLEGAVLRAVKLCCLETVAPHYFQTVQHSYHENQLFTSIRVVAI